MDDAEQAALAFLESEGFSDIVYEPDGNVPPDFLLNGRIAIEVRRLNQHFFRGRQPVPLEEARYSLAGRIQSLLQSFGAPAQGKSWFIGYRFARPAPSWRRIERAVRDWVAKVREAGYSEYVTRDVLPHFNLSAFPVSSAQEYEFLLGSYVDRDAGGFLVASIIENIPHCVDDKERKIALRRARYDTRWLCLVDHIAHSLDEHDRLQVEQWLQLSSSFDRIVLVNPVIPANSYALRYARRPAY